jgi:hypothetical protein
MVHPELSAEFHMVHLEMRFGKTRIAALRELGPRKGLDDIEAREADLAQTESFDTSIVPSLRTISEE